MCLRNLGDKQDDEQNGGSTVRTHLAVCTIREPSTKRIRHEDASGDIAKEDQRQQVKNNRTS